MKKKKKKKMEEGSKINKRRGMYIGEGGEIKM